MSKTQIAIIGAFWIIALIPLGTTLVIFVLTKTGVLATPIPDHYRGLIPKVASLLTAGGWIGLTFMAGGVGGGLAVAGVWVGVLTMFNATLNPWAVATTYWDHLLLIVLSAPAIMVICVTVLIFYAGWNGWDAKTRTADGKQVGP